MQASPDSVYEAVRLIGGGHGYYEADWLWKIRGFMDKAIGGPGLRRGRRDRKELSFGDALDFWRVLHADPGSRLALYAEMKLPGRAWLQFEVTPDEGGSRIRQTAVFEPAGLSGLVYWYGIYPLHGAIFAGMLRGIATRSGSTVRNVEPSGSSRKKQIAESLHWSILVGN